MHTARPPIPLHALPLLTQSPCSLAVSPASYAARLFHYGQQQVNCAPRVQMSPTHIIHGLLSNVRFVQVYIILGEVDRAELPCRFEDDIFRSMSLAACPHLHIFSRNVMLAYMDNCTV